MTGDSAEHKRPGVKIKKQNRRKQMKERFLSLRSRRTCICVEPVTYIHTYTLLNSPRRAFQ
jgi:hypothetical protein